MSEYWKSTPKYWCKHCAVYVRDTKLERQNHEATGKHQGALRRSLRDIHRAADQAERDRERARREVDRLNGVVSSAPSTKPTSSSSKPIQPPQQPTEAERKRQLEQLAELGVAIPTELRGGVAMAGEWTVTATRVVKAAGGEEDGEEKNEARATGVKRERERTEEEKEQEEAIKGLFGKRRKWGVDSKVVGEEEDGELEELLRGGLVKKEEVKKEEAGNKVKLEEGDRVVVKTEEVEEGSGEAVAAGSNEIKTEDGEASVAAGGDAPVKEEGNPVAVMFKKRKPKNIRQK